MTPVDHLIEQYWAGKATVSEKEQLYRYVHTLKPESSFDDFETFLDQVHPEQAEKTMTDEYARHLLSVIKQKAGISDVGFKKKRNFRNFGFAVAACILVAAFISIPWLLRHNDLSPNSTSKLARLQKSPQPVSKYISNQSNTVLDTVLPDHSHVSIFPNSSIAFIDGFELHARRLSLQGKARFHVAKDKARPFQVWAGGLITTAIGTIFEVNTHNQHQTDIKLIEGKISVKRVVQHNADSMVLHAGESLVYLIQQNKITLNNGIPEESIRNAKAELVFNDLPLSLVFKQLEMEYGIVIEYEAPATDIRSSARFQKNIGPDKIISTIVQQNKLAMVHSGGVYSIK